MINPTGEISIPVKSTTYKKTYEQMSDLINHMFPPLCRGADVDEEYATSNYWDVPLHKDIDLDWG
tara:strand:- start:967 stop:1161 length:195 start_codon:yes stop_codon:yes gene_type:complete